MGHKSPLKNIKTPTLLPIDAKLCQNHKSYTFYRYYFISQYFGELPLSSEEDTLLMKEVAHQNNASINITHNVLLCVIE